MKKIPPVAKIPLNKLVYDILVDSIVKGDIPLGTELREQHIAKQLEVSTTPVREAFKRLESDGLIEIIPYCGAVVRGLDPKEITEAYACREALEHLVVQEAIHRFTPKDGEQLYELLERFRTAQGIADISSISQQFDDYLYALSGNQTLTNLLGSLRKIISRDRKYSAGSPERQSAIYQEHRAIVDAIVQGDVDAAKQAVSRHIQNGASYIKAKQ